MVTMTLVPAAFVVASVTGAFRRVTAIGSFAPRILQALSRALRLGERSAFTHEPSPCERLSLEEEHDFATNSSQYAYLRIRDDCDALYDDDHLFTQPADPAGFLD